MDIKKIAASLANPVVHNSYIEYGAVGAALETIDGNIYTGISIDTACSLGHCAEHGAIAEMLKNKEFRIKTIVAVDCKGDVVPPCGRCRELIGQLSSDNRKTLIEVANGEVRTLEELVPYDWKISNGRTW
ncbi:cytidine deaminase family protein [Sphingobacterium faecale]|uniref:CMP/dCMP-type deaminase domain-containing protein n=1 Tax=Sphingobacterium faecale TaxID=2803775 RepID=A0ABS1R3Z6_9SPHI|nr:hypothetical protein [Sphingobacterium faecale]MBL1409383.1 hypothetical protein [Sphingobacterium faecale]